MSKPPLDDDSYRRWRLIRQPALSPDGNRVLYLLAGLEGPPELRLFEVGHGERQRIAGVASAGFAFEGEAVLFLAVAAEGEEAATTLRRLDPSSGAVESIAPASDFQLSPDGRVALVTPAAGGDPIWVDLEHGIQRPLRGAIDCAFGSSGSTLVYVVERGRRAGVWKLAGAGVTRAHRLHRGEGCRLPVLSEGGRAVAFLVDAEGGRELWIWRRKGSARRLLAAEPPGVDDGWELAERAPRPAANGSHVLIWRRPVPAPPPADPVAVSVEVWHWAEPELMSEQIHDLGSPPPAYVARVETESGRLVQLADPDLPEVDAVPAGGRALGTSTEPYRLESSWTDPTPTDYWVVETDSGDRRRLVEGISGDAWLRPDGRLLVAWDGESRHWIAVDADSGRRSVLSSGLPVAFQDEDHDEAGPPPPYGFAGWTADGRAVVYDRYDLWALAADDTLPEDLTGGFGRRGSVRLRLLEGESPAAGEERPVYLQGFVESTKGSGIYASRLPGEPEPLTEVDRELDLLALDSERDRALFTLQSVRHFPDLWLSDARFADVDRVSEANPCQDDYNWATAELVDWKSEQGEPLQGILYKPEDFDPDRRYPLVIFLYERFSDHLHHHFTPLPSPPPVVVPTVYASRGYLVLIPDVRYRLGAPGASLVASVRPIVHLLERRGLVDASRVGASSHSWGGYEVAWLAAHTDLLAAAAAGAPVSDMRSGYLGLRAADGESRMYEYESGQSRIGATPWEAPEAYVENSVLPAAERIEAPMLILHNRNDGAVPFSEGRALFLALRRLRKPAWLVGYADEGHELMGLENQLDWNVRLREFFDHLLVGGPAPAWLERGIPAADRKRTLGLEPAE